MRFEDKLIENLGFGRSRLNSRVFEKLFISYSYILFIKHCAFRSFCIKMLCFSKIWFFQIFRSIELVAQPIKIAIKNLVWIYLARSLLDWCWMHWMWFSINWTYFLTDWKSFREFFLKNISFSRVLHCFKTFEKAFWLSFFDRSNSSHFLLFFPQFFLKVFVV